MSGDLQKVSKHLLSTFWRKEHVKKIPQASRIGVNPEMRQKYEKTLTEYHSYIVKICKFNKLNFIDVEAYIHEVLMFSDVELETSNDYYAELYL